MTNRLTNFALDKFIKSDYLRETTNLIPLNILAIAIRGSFNFLITSRLKSGKYWIDFPFSIFITVILTIYTPVFYSICNAALLNDINNLSINTIDGIWNEGWIFIDLWKTRILGFLGIFTIFILFFIEVNSRMIQEFIFHTMLSSLIVEYFSSLSSLSLIYKDRIEKEIKEGNNIPVKVIIKEQPKRVLLEASNSYSNLKELMDSDTEDTKEEENILQDVMIIDEYLSKSSVDFENYSSLEHPKSLNKSIPTFGSIENFEPSSDNSDSNDL